MNYLKNNEKVVISNKILDFIKLLIAFLISIRLSILPNEIFKDRDDYIYLIDNSSVLLASVFYDDKIFLLSEPLFKLLNIVLSYTLGTETIISLYVFINCFIVTVFVLFTRKGFVFSILGLFLLLTIPYFYGGVLGAVRQTIGLSIILISLMMGNTLTSKKFLFSLFLASLFHVIFFVFFALSLTYKIICKITNKDKYIFPMILIIVLLVGVFWSVVTPYLSASQKYEEFEHSTSGITFLGWFIVFLLFTYNYYFIRKNNQKVNETTYKLALFMFFCFLVFYWFAPGPYRILYACMPILVSSLISNLNKYSFFCFLIVFIYSLLLLSIGSGAGSMNIKFSQFLSIVFLIT